MKKSVKAVWTAFKTQPLKFGAGLMMVSLSLYVFFGGVNFKASHGDTKIEISTDND